MAYSELKEIPILETLTSLGLEYKKVNGNEYHIYEGGTLTNGWSVNTEKNVVKDFSHSRGEGGNLKFVMSYLGTSKEGAVEWFYDKGLLEKPDNGMSGEFFSLPKLSDKQKEYLKSRGIIYSKISYFVRDYNGAIACGVNSKSGMVGICYRRITDVHGDRFGAITGSNTKGFYGGIADEDDKRVIICEGMFDFLTLKQFFPNVIGMKSCNEGYEQVNTLIEGYKIFLAIQNDDSSKKIADTFSAVDHSIFNWESLGENNGFKDINDICISCGCADNIVEHIFENCIESNEISSLFKELREKIVIEKNNGGMLGIPGPIKEIYDMTKGVIPGKCYYIAAYSNTGKSKYLYFHAAYYINMGKRVCFISLEEDNDEVLREIVCSGEKIKGEEIIDMPVHKEKKYAKNLVVRNIFELDGIEDYLKANTFDVVIIDYAQLIDVKGASDYEKNKTIALRLQKLALHTRAIFFIAAQISEGTNKDLNASGGGQKQFSIKGAGEYFFSAVAMFGLQRGFDGGIRLYIQKNKKGKKYIRINLGVDYERNLFTFQGIEEDF